MATLRNAILAARDAMTSATAVTDLVPAAQITFGNSPQKQLNPRIVIEVAGAEYTPTYLQSRKVQTYSVEYAIYSESVDQCTAIMDEVRLALDGYSSSDYAVRVTDESFQAEVDNVLLGVVVAEFQDSIGIPGFDVNAGATLAAWEAAAGMTLAEFQALPAPAVAYPNYLHTENYDDTTNVWGPNSYTGKLNSGALSPGPAPANVLYVAEVDHVNDQEFLKTLVNNNAFGNKHRFTYDDGTEATEVFSNSTIVMDGGNVSLGPGLDGYAGSNPRYVIDHLTGLGWYRSSFSVQGASTGAWHESRGMYDHFTDTQDLIDKPSTFNYAGFSDWRRPSIQEWTSSLGTVDVSNSFSGSDQTGRDPYFPPMNQFARGYGGMFIMLGPHDHANESTSQALNWWFPLSQTNGSLVTLTSEAAIASSIASGGQGTYATIMCRRHYSNS